MVRHTYIQQYAAPHASFFSFFSGKIILPNREIVRKRDSLYYYIHQKHSSSEWVNVIERNMYALQATAPNYYFEPSESRGILFSSVTKAAENKISKMFKKLAQFSYFLFSNHFMN